MIVEHYEKIKLVYDNYLTELMLSGQFPARDTGIGYWGVTPVKEAFEFFKKFGLYRFKNFLDLGSGDGRIVLLASLFDVHSHGIEYDEELIFKAQDVRRNLQIPHFEKTKFLQKDFLEHDFSQYDVIYVSPDKPFHRSKLDGKLKNELRGRLVVHGWEFFPQGLQEESSHVIDGEKFVVYRNG